MPRAQQHTHGAAAPQGRARSAPAGNARTGGRLPNLALPFVVLSLVALAVIPAVIQAEAREIRNEITDVLDPARFLITEIRFDLARQMAALRGFVITGEQRFLDRYILFVRDEATARRALAPLAIRAGPEVARSFAELTRSADAWHGRIQEAGILQRRAIPRDFLGQLALEQAEYEQALAAAERLERVIIDTTNERRAEIRTADAFQLRLTVALAVLALAAAIIVARISRRLGIVARESEARRREIERVVEARARFVRGITHDLKNPLGAADGYAQLLATGVRGEVTPGQREWIERLRRSIHQALAIIDDVLLLSRAETGRLEADIRSVHLAGLVREAVEDHQAAAHAAGIDLRLEPIPPDLPRVHTDPRRVRQIIGNLLSNAVKYTPEGGRVRVSLAAPAQSPLGAAPAVAIAVSDTGPGIPPEARELIFEEFTRVDTARTRGAGLGLAISQRLARLLGGAITVDSAVGMGSTFTVWLPLLSPAAAPGAEAPRAA